MAPTPETNTDLIQWDALRHQSSRFTYCLIDETEQKMGTAIAVKLGQRFFFATAKHLIDNNHEMTILAVHPLAPATSSDFIAKHFHERLDIGLLELNSAVADRFDFAESTRLLEEFDSEGTLPGALVIGFPRQFIRSAETQITADVRLRIIRTDSLVLRSVVLPQSQWPSNSTLLEPLNPTRDLLVDYKPESQVRHLPPGTSVTDVHPVDCPELDPCGMSGGGIWLAYVEQRNEGLLLPDVRLIGIQTGWYRQSGWLKGLRIGVWLNLIRTMYPDLQESS